MYHKKEIKSADGEILTLYSETPAQVWQNSINYYFKCSKCKNQSWAGDSDTQWDCNNYIEIEDKEKTRKGKLKIYCLKYEKGDIK